MNYYCAFCFHVASQFMYLRNDKFRAMAKKKKKKIVKMRIIIVKMLDNLMILRKSY